MNKIDGSLRAYWNKLKLCEFDQDTIKGLYITIREFAPKNSIARDIGDTIAHTDRTKGYVFTQIGVIDKENYKNDIGGITHRFTFPIPYDAMQFPKEIAFALLERGIVEKEEALSVTKEFSDEIIVCIFCLMHNTKVLVKKDINYWLQISGNYLINGVGMPIMTMMALSETESPFIAFESDVLYGDYFKGEIERKNLNAIRRRGKLFVEVA